MSDWGQWTAFVPMVDRPFVVCARSQEDGERTVRVHAWMVFLANVQAEREREEQAE